MYLIFIFLNLTCCILFLQHDFDIEEIDTPCMRKAILRHMGRLLKRFRYELHSHWKEVFGARGPGGTRETPHRNISCLDWDLLCNKYEDPIYQI